MSLVDPVNPYSQVDRATKYAVLFVLLTFTAFFMYEFLKGLRIHPIQYGLVGMAISIFFLLLLALSEHVPFGLAYAVAALFGVLYSALYALLVSEDNAMVLGSGLLFGVLAAITVLTRKVDWYRPDAT